MKHIPIIVSALLVAAVAFTACGSANQQDGAAAAPPIPQPVEALPDSGSEEEPSSQASAQAVLSEPATEMPSQPHSGEPSASTVAEVQPEPGANSDQAASNTLYLTVGEQVLSATLADNASARALRELLSDGPLTIDMQDYGNMEKVGDLGAVLPTDNQQITTEPGDLILYQGSSFVIYYAPNTWSLTPLGKLNDISQAELREILGSGNVGVTLSLEQE